MAKASFVFLFQAVLVLICFSGVNSAGQISKNDFWRVDLLKCEQLSVRVGDMILVKTRTFPLVPANLKKRFEVKFAPAGQLRLVAEEPPEGEGYIGKRYYFLVLQAGESEVQVTLKEEGREVETLKLSVSASE